MKQKFERSGIGFKNLCDVGFLIEGRRVLQSVLDSGHKFECISSYHLDEDWYFMQHAGIRTALVPAQGASISVNSAERLLASGAMRIIRLGTCGALDWKLTSGQIMVHYAGIRDEGTSPFYIDKLSPAIADIDLTVGLSNHMRAHAMKVGNGIIWTTDGRRKESHDRAQNFIKNGAVTVDMETSALFAFGLDRKVSVASISVVEDAVHEVREPADKEKRFKEIVLPQVSKAFTYAMDYLEKKDGR